MIEFKTKVITTNDYNTLESHLVTAGCDTLVIFCVFRSNSNTNSSNIRTAIPVTFER
jgi:hypothetical protein